MPEKPPRDLPPQINNQERSPEERKKEYRKQANGELVDAFFAASQKRDFLPEEVNDTLDGTLREIELAINQDIARLSGMSLDEVQKIFTDKIDKESVDRRLYFLFSTSDEVFERYLAGFQQKIDAIQRALQENEEYVSRGKRSRDAARSVVRETVKNSSDALKDDLREFLEFSSHKEALSDDVEQQFSAFIDLYTDLRQRTRSVYREDPVYQEYFSSKMEHKMNTYLKNFLDDLEKLDVHRKDIEPFVKKFIFLPSADFAFDDFEQRVRDFLTYFSQREYGKEIIRSFHQALVHLDFTYQVTRNEFEQRPPGWSDLNPFQMTRAAFGTVFGKDAYLTFFGKFGKNWDRKV